MAVTSADVAREAGLSRATVSYVLNDTSGQSIPEATRRRVLEAAQRLGYVPHAAARAMRLGRSDAVLFPLGDVSMTSVLGNAINACSAALNRHGFTLVADATRYETTDAAASAWLRLGPAAFIDLTMSEHDPAVQRLVAAGIPRVSADMAVPEELAAMHMVSLGARKVQLAHVAERGAQRVVFAALPHVVTSPEGQLLREQLGTAAEQVGLELAFEALELTQTTVGAAVDRWMRSDHPPDAVCSDSDDLALPILSALIARGIDVPRDVLVIGVDDLPPSRAMSPSLSTVAWVLEPLGEAIAAGVRSAIDTPESPVRYAPPECRIMCRDSTNRPLVLNAVQH